MQKEWLSFSVEETQQIAQEIAQMIERKEIPSLILLKGDIGSGKTTFVRGLLSFFHLEDMVSSPTFSIIHQYPHPKKTIYHIDLYRIRSVEELENLGLFEFFEEKTLVLIEWPEMLVDQLNFPHTLIELFYGEEENKRLLRLSVFFPNAM
ncbi:tRNA (adenosine(37)-N6)-threonylcarbamoyltransferase complex ATPase subunit type 1 TsaE [Thermospira aquatica]|uniref:tRNA threonylcarbamoyladenosine biosynthesis protein TsaE n=1 Tax=Thermospira aquatica TaxID=2828656 RepID=A0AAX3BCC5_9SPIR|nr:tRNA (adenosine(37)-N6)-threonylcarbamoyltransferase complex ATPase subunit type 1 TsaE [Thermospira aquatica]URA09795.1 tRNA (adenosine(37)-N6)-threonylcarbamoyltransferase complex ATPase subunit type 1 TsaE [Thermospira aquatica]